MNPSNALVPSNPGFGQFGNSAGGLFGSASTLGTAPFSSTGSVNTGTGSPPFTTTNDPDGIGNMVLHAITAMPAYKHKSFEELRLEDYAKGKKTPGFGPPSVGFGNTTTFGQSTGSSTLFGTTSTPNTSGVGMFGNAGTNQPPKTGLFGATSGASGALGTSGSGGLFGARPSNTGTGGFFGTQPPATTSGTFGTRPSATNASGGGFGAFSGTGTATGTSLFGSQPSTTTTSAFGSQPSTTTTGTLFGTQPSTTTSAFGSQPSTTTTGTSLFGSQPSTTTGTLFGTQPPTTTTGTLFGSQPSTTTTGTSLFGTQPSTTTTGTSLFGTQPSTTTTTGTSLFGSQPSTTTGTLFGSQPATTTTGTLFGSQPSTTTTGTSLFGSQPSTTTTGTLFGSQPSTTTTGTSLFGSQPPTGTPLFGGAAPTTSNLLAPSNSLGSNQPVSTFSFGQGATTTPSTILIPTTGSTQASIKDHGAYGSHPWLDFKQTVALPTNSPTSKGTLVSGSLHTLMKSHSAKPGFLASQRTGGLTHSVFEKQKNLAIKSDIGTFDHPPSSVSNGLTVKRSLKKLVIAPEKSLPEPKSQPEPGTKLFCRNTDKIDVESLGSGFSICPPIDEIFRQKKLEKLVVSRKGYGSIAFKNPDLTQLVFACSRDQFIKKILGLENGALGHGDRGVILFGDKSVSVYPPTSELTKPEPGQELNVPATISIENCFPMTRQDSEKPGKGFGNDSHVLASFLERLQNVKGTRFMDYDPELGLWTFEVNGF